MLSLAKGRWKDSPIATRKGKDKAKLFVVEPSTITKGSRYRLCLGTCRLDSRMKGVFRRIVQPMTSGWEMRTNELWT